MYSCPECKSNWQSVTNAHCSVCHRTFRNISGFDQHRIVEDTCLDPIQYLGMLDIDGIWATPQSHRQRMSLQARADRARDARLPTIEDENC